MNEETKLTPEQIQAERERGARLLGFDTAPTSLPERSLTPKPQQEPSVGRVVHFMYGDQHIPAIITDPAFRTPDPIGGVDIEWQALTAFPVNEPPFTTLAAHDERADTPATWHWPEYVPAKG
jgi:hypothetical protein